MKRKFVAATISCLAVIASAHAQLSFNNLILNVNTAPTGSYVGTTTGYFYSYADVEGPGSGSLAPYASCDWYGQLTWASTSTPESSVTYKITLTDTATAYYYLRGSGSNPSSGLVDSYGAVSGDQSITANPGIIYQASTTQTATDSVGPVAKSVTFSGAPAWVYNPATLSWTGQVFFAHERTSVSGELQAPTYGNVKENESSGYAEDNCTFVSIS